MPNFFILLLTIPLLAIVAGSPITLEIPADVNYLSDSSSVNVSPAYSSCATVTVTVTVTAMPPHVCSPTVFSENTVTPAGSSNDHDGDGDGLTTIVEFTSPMPIGSGNYNSDDDGKISSSTESSDDCDDNGDDEVFSPTTTVGSDKDDSDNDSNVSWSEFISALKAFENSLPKSKIIEMISASIPTASDDNDADEGDIDYDIYEDDIDNDYDDVSDWLYRLQANDRDKRYKKYQHTFSNPSKPYKHTYNNPSMYSTSAEWIHAGPGDWLDYVKAIVGKRDGDEEMAEAAHDDEPICGFYESEPKPMENGGDKCLLRTRVP